MFAGTKASGGITKNETNKSLVLSSGGEIDGTFLNYNRIVFSHLNIRDGYSTGCWCL